MKTKFSAGDLVPIFKDLEIDNDKSRRWDKAAGLSKQNWDMGTALALGGRDPRPPPITFL